MRYILLCSCIIGFLSSSLFAQDTSGTRAANKTFELNDEKVEIIQNAVLKDLNGKDVSVKDYKGKVVILNFWESWSKSSLSSLSEVEEIWEKYPKDVIVLAINSGWKDKPDKIKKFEEENFYKFTYLLGNDLVKSIGLTKLPFKVFLDKNGNIIDTIFGSFPDKREYENCKAIVEKCLIQNKN